MPTAVPVRDLKDSAKFCQKVRESDGPIVVTRNGYDEFYVLSPELYHELEMARRRQELYAAVEAAEGRLAASGGVTARSALSQLRQRYGL
ncbi:MAG: type II toxin-antitoxin system Phd/YefM family antitoxin [Coriobacteriales bacterium]|nr:type II toxin-antitoxin system Phd/YefM family antitoxin [Coriobacteriales bacterium]